MALPSTAAAAPMGAPDDAMPPAGDAPELDAANADEGQEPEVIATICVNKDGTYVLYAGDEPDDMGGAPGEEAAPEGKSFDSPQALMKGVMELLNPTTGAEDAFQGATKGGGPMPAM